MLPNWRNYPNILPKELKGKIALVTGSTGQLGSAITLALARAGCHCVCHYHKSKAKADQLVSDIGKLMVNANALCADLTSPNQIETLFEDSAKFGTCQILINSAALFYKTPLESLTMEQARELFDLNVTAALLTSRVFARHLSENSGQTGVLAGKIINIAGVSGVRPWARYCLYSASKAGLIAATKALAKELAPDILVNAVAPGIASWPEPMTAQEEKRRLSFIPLGRFAEKQEIAAAVIFLLQNDYITGQTLTVDGGRSI